MQPTTDLGVTPDAPPAERRPDAGRAMDLLVVSALVALAAILRLPNLVTRGTWDGDQGHDMLVLRAWVQDGVIPLLGPPTSIGDVHHGALYYYLLAPGAFLTGGDSPLAVVLEIALAGIAAVAVTWWLARSIAGPVAGIVAGLLLAVSTSAVDGSTFIWNPNLIALSSAVALAGAWRAVVDPPGAMVDRGGSRDGGHRPVPRPRHRDGPDRGGAAGRGLASSGRGGACLGRARRARLDRHRGAQLPAAGRPRGLA